MKPRPLVWILVVIAVAAVIVSLVPTSLPFLRNAVAPPALGPQGPRDQSVIILCWSARDPQRFRHGDEPCVLAATHLAPRPYDSLLTLYLPDPETANMPARFEQWFRTELQRSRQRRLRSQVVIFLMSVGWRDPQGRVRLVYRFGDHFNGQPLREATRAIGRTLKRLNLSGTLITSIAQENPRCHVPEAPGGSKGLQANISICGREYHGLLEPMGVLRRLQRTCAGNVSHASFVREVSAERARRGFRGRPPVQSAGNVSQTILFCDPRKAQQTTLLRVSSQAFGARISGTGNIDCDNHFASPFKRCYATYDAGTPVRLEAGVSARLDPKDPRPTFVRWSGLNPDRLPKFQERTDPKFCPAHGSTSPVAEFTTPPSGAHYECVAEYRTP